MNNECIIDTNILVLHIFSAYCDEIGLPHNVADQLFELIIPDTSDKRYASLNRHIFHKRIIQFRRFHTTSYILGEAEIILRKLKYHYAQYKEIFPFCAELFRQLSPQIDYHTGLVEIIDTMDSQKVWSLTKRQHGRRVTEEDKAISLFGIQDMSIIALARRLNLPILTTDGDLFRFIQDGCQGITAIEL